MLLKKFVVISSAPGGLPIYVETVLSHSARALTNNVEAAKKFDIFQEAEAVRKQCHDPSIWETRTVTKTT